jgi:type IV secretion system protein VirB8
MFGKKKAAPEVAEKANAEATPAPKDKPADQATGQKPVEQQPVDQATEQKPIEQQPVEKIAEQKPIEQKTEQKAAEQPKAQPKAQSKTKAKGKDKAKKSYDWYQDRYNFIAIQRNFLSLIVLCCLLVMFVGLIYINQISQNKSIEPFIVEIEEKTGIPTIVDQVSIKEYKADEVIQEFFIYNYIRSREGYDYRTYHYDYHSVARLLSDVGVYRGFRRMVSTRNENSPVNIYARDVRLEPKVKSIQDIEGAKQIRIVVKHLRGNVVVAEDHKIIYMKYNFVNLNLTLEERLVNPLGFRVSEYRIDQDFVGNK